MKWLGRLFDFYLDASIHVALSVSALILATYWLFSIPVDFDLLLFLFFGSISCYNFVKYGVEAEKYLRLVRPYHRHIQYFSFFCLLLAAYHARSLQKETWIGIAILMGMTGLYALPLLPKSKNLRSWGGIKIFMVAAVWAGATVILPFIEAGEGLVHDVRLETLQRMVLVLVLLVPFEIRDLQYDAAALRTIPQRFGVAKTRILGLGLTMAFFFSIFLKDTIGPLELWGKGLMTLLLVGVLLATTKNQSKYFASFWVEAIPLFWVVFLMVLRNKMG